LQTDRPPNRYQSETLNEGATKRLPGLDVDTGRHRAKDPHHVILHRPLCTNVVGGCVAAVFVAIRVCVDCATFCYFFDAKKYRQRGTTLKPPVILNPCDELEQNSDFNISVQHKRTAVFYISEANRQMTEILLFTIFFCNV